MELWLIYNHTDRINAPTAKKFIGDSGTEIVAEMKEFLEDRPNIEAIDVAKSAYEEK